MKLLKKILIAIVIFIILLLVIAYFLTRKMEVTATDKIEAPAKIAFNLVNDFKNHEKWDPWVETDTTLSFAYSENTLGEGAYIDYKSAMMGTGRSTRTTSKQDEQIILTTATPDMVGSSLMSFDFAPDGESSGLTWNFETEMPWPMNLMNFFFERSMQKDMQRGVKNISNLATERWKKNIYDGYEVSQEIRESMHYVTNRNVVPFDQADKYHSQSMQPLFKKIQESGVKMEGFSSALVYNFDQEKMTLDMAAAIPIKTLEAGKVLVVDYYGDRADSAPAHFAIDDYMRDRGLFNSYPVVEEYITDPMEEKDPSKWLTKVIYYLSE